MKYHIAYICDDNYAIPTYVSMVSVKDNAGDGEYDVHVVTVGLSADNKRDFCALETNFFHVIIHEINLFSYKMRIDQISQRTHVTPTALLKFELANILGEVDKVLYLDSDVIVKKNIDELLDYPIAGFYGACAPELWKVLHRDNAEEKWYFNSGVMLLNLRLLREDKASLKLWEEKIRLSKDAASKTMDQDTLNNVFSQRISPLHVKYNFNPYFAQKRYLKLINNFSDIPYYSTRALTEEIRIIHYVGKEDKPWIYSNARMAGFWDNYYLKVKENLNDLGRKKSKRGVKYRLESFQKSVKKRGLIKTVNLVFRWRL